VWEIDPSPSVILRPFGNVSGLSRKSATRRGLMKLPAAAVSNNALIVRVVLLNCILNFTTGKEGGKSKLSVIIVVNFA
jgi:hypothetical protein